MASLREVPESGGELDCRTHSPHSRTPSVFVMIEPYIRASIILR